VSTFRHAALAAFVLAAAVGGCAVIDRPDPRHDTINRAAANARNESILLNIIRASHDVPLNFVAFSRVSGSQSTQVNVGLPGMTSVNDEGAHADVLKVFDGSIAKAE
jgi:hypothetical protein